MESRKIIGLQTISVERQYRINDAKDEDEACCEGILEVWYENKRICVQHIGSQEDLSLSEDKLGQALCAV